MPTLSIDFTAQQATRMSVAIRNVLRLDHDATPVEVKAYWISEMQRLVRNVETDVATRQITTATLDLV